MSLTFAAFLTPAGVVAAAAAITMLVQLLKGVFPTIDARVSGAILAFSLSAVLYAATAAATGLPTWDAGLTVFLAWLSCATSSVGIKAATDHAVASAA